MSDVSDVRLRTQIGTVELLQERVYPRYPIRDQQLTTATPFVEVGPGLWPVYRQDETDLIYWEMSGVSITLEPTFRSMGDGMFTTYNDVVRGDTVTFRSRTFTPDEFDEFRTTDPTVLPGDGQRLVFDVERVI